MSRDGRPVTVALQNVVTIDLPAGQYPHDLHGRFTVCLIRIHQLRRSMKFLTHDSAPSKFMLWGLIRESRYADRTGNAFGCLCSKAHLCDGEWVEGLLLFPTPLQAEIYRKWMENRGEIGWRLFRTTDEDVVSIIGKLRDEWLQLWVAVGFAASETQQLLLDDSHLLMTSSIGIDIPLSRAEDGHGAALRFPSRVVCMLTELFSAFGAAGKTAENARAEEWIRASDQVWEEDARDALGQISTWRYADYQSCQGNEGVRVSFAQFDEGAGNWVFAGNVPNTRH